MPMMSWQPRTMERNPFIAGPRVRPELHREDVERERQPELDRRLPERVVDRVVVVGLAGLTGHHHAAQTGVGDGVDVGDAVVDGAHRGLPATEQPIGAVPRSTPRSSGCRPGSTRACSRSRDGCRAASRRSGRSPRPRRRRGPGRRCGRLGSHPLRCSSSKPTPATVIFSGGLPAAATRPERDRALHAVDDEHVAVGLGGRRSAAPCRATRRRCSRGRCRAPR